jgi:hypothetical protein
LRFIHGFDWYIRFHDLGYLFSALRLEGLIADELVLQLATFLRSLDLFLELTVRTVNSHGHSGSAWAQAGRRGPRAFAHSFQPQHMALINSASNTQGPVR